MKKLLVFFTSLTMCFGLIVYKETTVHAGTMEDKGYRDHSDLPVELVFANDSTYRNNLLLEGSSVNILPGEVSANYDPIDIKTDTLSPGKYEITCKMAGFSSDLFLYENGGNIYDKQNDIILPTVWTVENRTYTAEFTVTTPTNRLTLGENSTYIKVTEPSSYKRFVMIVFLKNSY